MIPPEWYIVDNFFSRGSENDKKSNPGIKNWRSKLAVLDTMLWNVIIDFSIKSDSHFLKWKKKKINTERQVIYDGGDDQKLIIAERGVWDFENEIRFN